MRARINLTQQQETYLRRYYDVKTFEDMSHDLGVSMAKIHSWLTDLGLKKTRNAKGSFVSDEEFKEAVNTIVRYQQQRSKASGSHNETGRLAVLPMSAPDCTVASEMQQAQHLR